MNILHYRTAGCKFWKMEWWWCEVGVCANKAAWPRFAWLRHSTLPWGGAQSMPPHHPCHQIVASRKPRVVAITHAVYIKIATHSWTCHVSQFIFEKTKTFKGGGVGVCSVVPLHKQRYIYVNIRTVCTFFFFKKWNFITSFHLHWRWVLSENRRKGLMHMPDKVIIRAWMWHNSQCRTNTHTHTPIC